MPNLSDLAESNEQIIHAAILRAKAIKDENVRTTVLVRAIEEVRDKLSDVKISNMSDKVTVKNLDEVRLSLRKELTRAIAPLLKEMDALNLTKEQIQTIKDQSEMLAIKSFDDNFDTLIVKKPKQRFEVSNLSDIQFPKDMVITNLADLQSYFDSLAETIRDTFNIEIPTPQVNVAAPSINIPETVINVPELDLSPLLDALSPLQLLSNKATNPLSVRFSNGEEFVDLIRQLIEGQQRSVQAFTGSQGATKKDISRILGTPSLGGSGVKSLSDSAVAVQISSSATRIRWVEVSAVKQPIAIGASNAVVDLTTAANCRGVILYPGSNPYRIETQVLSSVYVAGPTGSAASYNYYV